MRHTGAKHPKSNPFWLIFFADAGAVQPGELVDVVVDVLGRGVQVFVLPVLHQQHHQSGVLRPVQRLLPAHLRPHPHL